MTRLQMIKVLAALSLIFAASAASAQAVYKCVPGCSVVYSNEPSLGAQVVDTTSTQGMDKSSGMSRKGAAVSDYVLSSKHRESQISFGIASRN